ncbi:MAG: hypothetical protein IPL79_03805 [Myxococcales bacterium]|nr:hypothetical protein [Myxococcales bacterium]
MLGLLLQACSSATAPPTKTNHIEYKHSNGLSLQLPPGFAASQIADGFVVRDTASLDTRNPKVAHITLQQRAELPAGEWLETKSAAGRRCLLRRDREDGGSGGESHRLTAKCPYSEGYVQIVQVTQAEWPSSLDHSLASMVIDAINEPRPPKVH